MYYYQYSIGSAKVKVRILFEKTLSFANHHLHIRSYFVVCQQKGAAQQSRRASKIQRRQQHDMGKI